MLSELEGLFRKADADGSGTLDKLETLGLFSRIGDQYPQAETYAAKIRDEDLFEAIDADGSGELDVDEFKTLLLDVDASMRNLPPTAQARSQQPRARSASRAQAPPHGNRCAVAVLGTPPPSPHLPPA